MLGDTTVVRTESGSVWGAPAHLVEEVAIGEMDGADEYLFGQVAAIAAAPDGTVYVLDRQGPSLRAYGPDGRYLRTLGRQGEGPGELKQPDSGLSVLSDGRVVVRDPGNARLQVYGPEGEPLATWSTMGGNFTSEPLWADASDNVYTQAVFNPEADYVDRIWGLAQVHPDGSAGDTLRRPDQGFEPVSMTESNGGMTAVMGVPFTPNAQFALHPQGWMVHGVSTAYRIVVSKPDAPLVIERAAASVPVTPGEKTEGEARITRNMRRMFPDWSWNGPPIPDRSRPSPTSSWAGTAGSWCRSPSRPSSGRTRTTTRRTPSRCRTVGGSPWRSTSSSRTVRTSASCACPTTFSRTSRPSSTAIPSGPSPATTWACSAWCASAWSTRRRAGEAGRSGPVDELRGCPGRRYRRTIEASLRTPTVPQDTDGSARTFRLHAH